MMKPLISVLLGFGLLVACCSAFPQNERHVKNDRRDEVTKVNGAAIPMAAVAATGAGQSPVSTGEGTAYMAKQVMPLGFGYTFYIDGRGNTNARNNQTGAVDYVNADAGVAINAAINKIAGTCGHLNFEPGVYNIDSLVQETASGYTAIYYGIGIPGNAGTNLNCQWTIEGDGAPPLLDQFSAPVQTNGVIFNVTSKALGTVRSTTWVNDLWARPGTDTVGPNVTIRNVDFRFPSNQRGYETGSDMSRASNATYDGVMADTAVAQSNLAFPAANSYGLTTTASGHEENYMRNATAIGYYVDLDIQSEHSVLVNSYGVNGAYCIDYGVRGGKVYHASSWMSSGWGECRYGLTIGENVQAGSLLDIAGLDIEDADSGIWLPAYHAKETNAGNAFGRIDYSRVLQGIGVSVLPTLFDGGGGTAFALLNSAGAGTETISTRDGVSYEALSSSGNYAGIHLLNSSPAAATSKYEFGTGYPGETTYGVETKWFISDGIGGKMRMAGDASGNVNIGYTTPYPKTFPALFSVGTSGQFQVDGLGNVRVGPSLTLTNSGTATQGDVNILAPNLVAGNSIEFHQFAGSIGASNNGNTLGFHYVGAGDTCNEAFMRTYSRAGATVQTAANGNAGVSTAIFCPAYPWDVVGAIHSSVNVISPAVQLVSTTPAVCSSGTAGQFRYVQGNATTKDSVSICAHDASNVYAWRTIY